MYGDFMVVANVVNGTWSDRRFHLWSFTLQLIAYCTLGECSPMTSYWGGFWKHGRAGSTPLGIAAMLPSRSLTKGTSNVTAASKH